MYCFDCKVLTEVEVELSNWGCSAGQLGIGDSESYLGRACVFLVWENILGLGRIFLFRENILGVGRIFLVWESNGNDLIMQSFYPQYFLTTVHCGACSAAKDHPFANSNLVLQRSPH